MVVASRGRGSPPPGFRRRFFVASLPQSPPADLGRQALSTPRAIGSAAFGAGGALTLTAVGPPAIKAPWTLPTCTSTIDALDGLAKNCVDGNGKALEHSGEKCSLDLLGEDPWTSTCNYKKKKTTNHYDGMVTMMFY